MREEKFYEDTCDYPPPPHTTRNNNTELPT